MWQMPCSARCAIARSSSSCSVVSVASARSVNSGRRSGGRRLGRHGQTNLCRIRRRHRPSQSPANSVPDAGIEAGEGVGRRRAALHKHGASQINTVHIGYGENHSKGGALQGVVEIAVDDLRWRGRGINAARRWAAGNGAQYLRLARLAKGGGGEYLLVAIQIVGILTGVAARHRRVSPRP